MAISTQISNGTKHVMKVLVGSGRHVYELATVEAGGRYVILVDYNGTYQEYTVDVDAPGLETRFVISSDHEAGGSYVIALDYNATYREYTVDVDAPGLETRFVVRSDDLCDNKRITIKEENSKHVMKVPVGSGRHVSELATVEVSGRYVIAVDYNGTYREYTVDVDAPGLETRFEVSSDDLCDNKCITIKEENSKLGVQTEPRQSTRASTTVIPATDSTTTSKSATKHSWLRSWISK